MLKKIFSNTLAQLVAKFFGAGLTLLTTYFTIRLAGIEFYGDLTKILVLVAVGFTAIDFGLNAEGIRSSKSESDMRSNTQNILLARLALSVMVILCLNIIVFVLPGGYSIEVKSVFWLGSLAIIFQGIYSSGNSWFQYQLSYWKSAVSVITGSLFGALLTLYFLKYSPTLSNFVIANTLGYVWMSICTLILLPKLKFSQYNLKAVLPLLRRSLILGLILIASVLAVRIDTIILGIFRDSLEVGEYGFAYRIFDVILVLPVFVINAIYPLSIQQSQQKNESTLLDKTTKYLAGISIFIAAILWVLSPALGYIRPELSLATSVLKILSLSLPLFYMTAPLMWSLIAQKKDKIVLGIYIVAAILNTLLNLAFIPHYGVYAAAINTGLTELSIYLSLLHFQSKIPLS